MGNLSPCIPVAGRSRNCADLGPKHGNWNKATSYSAQTNIMLSGVREVGKKEEVRQEKDVDKVQEIVFYLFIFL